MLIFTLLSEISDESETNNLNATKDPHAELKAKILDNYEKNPEDFKRIEGTNQIKYDPNGWGSTERALSWYGFRRNLNK